ncbi:MAG TPA: hypothetical protein PLQ78_07830 [Flavipsychrobacter sp.]|nr:hypothetical protein [Flavipsychrobacter sp.]
MTLSEYEENNNFDINMTVDEIMDSIGQYILLERTYGEDEFDEDYYYFESSEFEKSGDLDDFEIILTENQFVLIKGIEKNEIQIHPSNQIFDDLKNALLKITKQKGKLKIQ